MPHTAHEAILAALAANGPMNGAELRTECAPQVPGYYPMMLANALYELCSNGDVLYTEEQPDEDTGEVYPSIYELNV